MDRERIEDEVARAFEKPTASFCGACSRRIVSASMMQDLPNSLMSSESLGSRFRQGRRSCRIGRPSLMKPKISERTI